MVGEEGGNGQIWKPKLQDSTTITTLFLSPLSVFKVTLNGRLLVLTKVYKGHKNFTINPLVLQNCILRVFWMTRDVETF